jgi:hypothetical protein|uniref:Uncharacterized protein n=1 Tax=viral metagenome TaxID=1070528 RepID=A0A6C0AKR1_9ZZZZ|tara:strand:+ start:894 stop:1391 length:498 start_codon:yes stop_codon:yes gene_type:complete
MSFTRFNYDDARTKKNLQQSTGPGRWTLNTPGNGLDLPMVNDPQTRMQRWGANLRSVPNGHPIDIDSDLIGLYKVLKKSGEQSRNDKPKKKSYPVNYPVYEKTMRFQSRVTHPAWQYLDLEQNHRYPLFLNPQENICKHFENNLNTRLLERDNYVPNIPDSPYLN